MDRLISDERLAAFLDGCLDEAERSEVLGMLARSESDREVLADTVAALDDVADAPAYADQERRPTVAQSPGTGRTSARWRRWAAPVAAAAVAGLLWVGIAESRGPWLRLAGSSGPASLERLGDAASQASDAFLSEGLRYRFSVVTTRGAIASDPAAVAVGRFRAGVTAVDLELASGLGLSGQVADLASGVAGLLREMDGLGPLAGRFEIWGANAGSLSPREATELLRDTREVLDGPFFRLGHDLARGRIAAELHEWGLAEEAMGAVDRDALAELGAMAGFDALERWVELLERPRAEWEGGMASLIRDLGT